MDVGAGDGRRREVGCYGKVPARLVRLGASWYDGYAGDTRLVMLLV